jgi:hypothetical protein
MLMISHERNIIDTLKETMVRRQSINIVDKKDMLILIQYQIL